MPVKLRISVTKEILEKSKNCGKSISSKLENCAVALAVRDIFPHALVYQTGIVCDARGLKVNIKLTDPPIDIMFPIPVIFYIKSFDEFDNNPEARIQMKEISFEVDVPDYVLDRINIDELKPLLVNHPTLELIEQ